MRKLIFISVLLLSYAAYAQQANITGKIINPTGDKVFLLKDSLLANGVQMFFPQDSCVLASDGSFKMSVNVNETKPFVFNDGNEIFNMLLTPEDDIHLTLNTKLFDETILFYGKGADKNNAIKNLNLFKESFTTQVYSFPQEIDTTTVFGFLDKSYKQYEEVLKDYRDQIQDFKSTAQKMLDDIEDEKNQIKMGINSEKAFNELVKSLIGKNAVDFEGVDLNDKKVKLSDFKGKTTVIDFWATWCSPCKAEMPSMQELEKKYGEKINFVSVALWCDKEGWKTMATDYGFKYNMFLDKGEEKQIKDYAVQFVPRYVVIDKDQKILDADAPRPSSGSLEQYF